MACQATDIIDVLEARIEAGAVLFWVLGWFGDLLCGRLVPCKASGGPNKSVSGIFEGQMALAIFLGGIPRSSNECEMATSSEQLTLAGWFCSTSCADDATRHHSVKGRLELGRLCGPSP